LTKKDNLAACAERMYIFEAMSQKEIAEMLKVHEKSVRNWKVQYFWDKKREQYNKSRNLFHADLFNFARKLMATIEYDMDNQNKIDPTRMFAFTKLLPLITKVKDYEDKINADIVDDTKKKELSPEFINMINEEFLGIKSDV